MVMAQQCYGYQDGLDFCRRSGQGVTLPISQPTRGDGHQDVSDGGSSRVSPASESDNKGNPPPRRRIQVACERCRKRKIKCSGDTGNGQGCMNCRSSGTPNCRFLRVNSAEILQKTWPYPTITSVVPSTSRSQAGSYGTHSSRTSSLSVESPTLRTVTYPRPPSGFENGTMGQPMYPRNQYCFDDDAAALYNVPSPAFMLPSADSNGISGFGGSPGSPKVWNTVAHAAAPTHMNGIQNGLYTDRDPSISMGTGTSSYPYLAPPLPNVSPPTDIPSLFPAMNSLTSNLSGGDRTLPNPATGRSQPFNIPGGGTGTQSESSPCMSFAPGPLYDYRAATQWAPNGIGSNNSQGSMRTMSSSAMSTSATNDNKTTSSSPQDLGFGYIPISGSPQPDQMNSAAPYTGAEAADSSDGYHSTAETGQFCRDDMLSSDNCGSEVYGYSTERSGRRSATDCSSSSGTLISGQQYTRVSQPQLLGSSSFNILRTAGTSDFRPETAHLPSVTTLGNNTAGF